MNDNRIIHIFRHGEVEQKPGIVDPTLTSYGTTKTDELITNLPDSMTAPTLIVVAPLRRCVRTALKAFHPDFNPYLEDILYDNTKPNPSCTKVMQHFAEGKVTFMVDPRLQEVRAISDTTNKRNKMPTRRQMSFSSYFVFPEEFYPSDMNEPQHDPDEDQDWFKEQGMWAGRFHDPQTLERGASFKEFLYNRPEKEIIVVSSNAFIDTLVHEPGAYMNYLECRSCIWKQTVSGRFRLVPLSNPESEKDIVKDEDYSDYWEYNPYKLSERSELYHKWYNKPAKRMYKVLLEIKERKNFLELNDVTLESLEAELDAELVDKIKHEVQENHFIWD